MKWLITTCLVCLLLTTAASQGAMTISFDENGNGSYVDDSGLIGKLVSGVDTPPEIGHATLYYILPTQSMTPGDLVVSEPEYAAALVISDVLRFVYLSLPGEVPIIQNRVYVYSDVELDERNLELADTGIPDVLQSNHWSWNEVGSEGSNGAIYTPPNNDWAGWMYGGVTYNFTSDVPEPATMALLGLGSLVLLKKRKA